MAQTQNKNEHIETENNLNFENIHSNQLMQQSLVSCINDSNDDNEEINQRIKRQKTNDDKTSLTQMRINKNNTSSQITTPQCNICQQPLNDLKVYQNNFSDAVYEDVALTDEKLHLSIDGEPIDDDLSPTYKLINFR